MNKQTCLGTERPMAARKHTARLIPGGAVSVLAILIAAGCSTAGGNVHAAALEPRTPPAVTSTAGSSSPGTAAAGQPGTGTASGTSPAPGTSGHSPGKTAKATATPARTGAAVPPPAGTPGDPPAAPGGGTAPAAGSTPVSPADTGTPPQEQASGTAPPSPAAPLAPAAQASCTVTAYKPVVQAVITKDEAGPGPENFSVSEYDTAGLLLERVVLSVPGPLTAGESVSAEGAQDTPMTSCQVTAVSSS